jgi:putative transcriptional regulator
MEGEPRAIAIGDAARQLNELRGAWPNPLDYRIIGARRASRRERAAYTLQAWPRPKPESRTDWDRLARMSDEEIERAARGDPEAPLTEEQLTCGFRRKALTALRKRLGLGQAEFARQFMLDLRTLQDWEQGRREPEGIARIYLRDRAQPRCGQSGVGRPGSGRSPLSLPLRGPLPLPVGARRGAGGSSPFDRRGVG